MASRTPQPGDVWMDYEAYRATRKLRELLVLAVDDENVKVHAISGSMPGKGGVPRGYFDDGTMIFQGFWALKHQTLERLGPP